MSTSVSLTAEAIEVSLTGMDSVLALRRLLRIPIEQVASASVVSVSDAKRQLGWRIGGGYFPGRFATGNFLSRRGLKGRQFWSVYRDTEVLQIDLSPVNRSHGNLVRIVIQTPDRAELAARINQLRLSNTTTRA